MKDVFPSANYVEDQKIFTIRSHGQFNKENISLIAENEEEEQGGVLAKTEVNAAGSIITQDDIVLGNLVTSSDDILTEDGNVLIQRINLDAVNGGCDIDSLGQSLDVDSVLSGVDVASDSIEDGGKEGDTNPKKDLVIKIEPNKDDDGEETKVKVKKHGIDSQTVGFSTVKELLSKTKRQIKPCSLTLMNIDGFSRYKVIDMDNEKENSLYAQARQEAALGLAELSLVGGIVVSEKRAGTTSRTVAREVEENSSEDPNVTKIILSKEGGIMNSQDPHQCPECKRLVCLLFDCLCCLHNSVVAMLTVESKIPSLILGSAGFISPLGWFEAHHS